VRTGTNPYSASYTVDGAGQRTSETVGGVTTSFTYDADAELLSTSGGFVNSYVYDLDGEQTSRKLSGVTTALTWDFDNQLLSAGSSSFTYDATGRRMTRTAAGVTTNFLYDGSSVLLEKQGSATTATYTYGNALVRKDGETPLFDGLGGERTVTAPIPPQPRRGYRPFRPAIHGWKTFGPSLLLSESSSLPQSLIYPNH
jgi:hypothetical protein